jgi:cysteine desulfurase
MHVNNETGVIQPVAELARILRNTPTYFHVDAAQGFAKVPEDLTAPIDLISISGHKIGAPKGIGALLLRRRRWDDVPVQPLMFGGGQEMGVRPGTLPVPLIMGLAKAEEVFRKAHSQWLSGAEAFREKVLAGLSATRYRVNGDPAHTVPHILNLSFDGVNAEALIGRLQQVAAVATGSACTSASYTPSHVLTAMGLPESVVANGLRLSWFPAQVEEFDPHLLANAVRQFQQ